MERKIFRENCLGKVTAVEGGASLHELKTVRNSIKMRFSTENK